MSDGEAPVLSVRDLHKTFRIGFMRKKVEAVRGVSFDVARGQIFGLLGPNGAGKTTTIKMTLRLIFPDSGDIRIFGKAADDREAVRRIGYMPENPYVYQYLRPLEFLDLCGRLHGIPRKERRERCERMLERVGLGHAKDRPIGKFSKGMMQRVGLAQALLHDPELLILDEPMSGLDPIGRKQIRDLLLEQRAAGKTLVFTSHILSDVELLCDRVVILRNGKVTSEGTMDELLHRGRRIVDVSLANVDASLETALSEIATVSHEHDAVVARVEGEDAVNPVLERALAGGARVISVSPHRETLEDFFVRDPDQTA